MMRNTKTLIFCNNCEAKSTHVCEGEYIDYTENECYRYRLYVCADCQTGVLEVFYTDIELCEENDCDYHYEVLENGCQDDTPGEFRYFPKRKSEYVRKPLYCNYCGQITSHICKGEHLDDAGSEFYRYRFYICTQCEVGLIESFYINNEDEFLPHPYHLLDEEDEYQGEFSYAPKRREFDHQRKKFTFAPFQFSELQSIYNEVVGALNNEMPILCAIGIRALLERICADQNIAGKNLKEKIDELGSKVGQNIAENLHSIRFLGNDAAHELLTPSKKEALLAIEICEDLITYLYEIEEVLRHKGKHLKRLFDERKEQPLRRWSNPDDWGQ